MVDRIVGSRGSTGRAGQGWGSSRQAPGYRRGAGDTRTLWASPWEGLDVVVRWRGTARCRRRLSRCPRRCPGRTSGRPVASHVSSLSRVCGPGNIKYTSCSFCENI